MTRVQNLIDFEKSSNKLLKALKEKENFEAFENIIIDKGATLLIPQSASLETVQVTHVFIQSHIVLTNPKNPLEWISLNGIRGFFDEAMTTLTVVEDLLNESETIAFFADPVSLFGPGSVFERGPKPEENPFHSSIPILRTTTDLQLFEDSTPPTLSTTPRDVRNFPTAFSTPRAVTILPTAASISTLRNAVFIASPICFNSMRCEWMVDSKQKQARDDRVSAQKLKDALLEDMHKTHTEESEYAKRLLGSSASSASHSKRGSFHFSTSLFQSRKPDPSTLSPPPFPSVALEEHSTADKEGGVRSPPSASTFCGIDGGSGGGQHVRSVSLDDSVFRVQALLQKDTSDLSFDPTSTSTLPTPLPPPQSQPTNSISNRNSHNNHQRPLFPPLEGEEEEILSVERKNSQPRAAAGGKSLFLKSGVMASAAGVHGDVPTVASASLVGGGGGDLEKHLKRASATSIVGLNPNSNSNNSPKNGNSNLGFSDFAEKMKHPSALPFVKNIKKFVESVLSGEVSNTPQEVLGQKAQSFFDSTFSQMRSHSLWAKISSEEADNTREGLERYVMIKIFNKAFAPLDSDKDRDTSLSRRISCLQPLTPQHLEIPSDILIDQDWPQAIVELLRLNNYKAPIDKLKCISNCCKLIFGILSRAFPDKPTAADDFLPVLIYLTLQANPPSLLSNISYITHFRNPSKMMSEVGYYFTNFHSAVVFLESGDHTSFSLDKAWFTKLLSGQSVSSPPVVHHNRGAQAPMFQDSPAKTTPLCQSQLLASSTPPSPLSLTPSQSAGSGLSSESESECEGSPPGICLPMKTREGSEELGHKLFSLVEKFCAQDRGTERQFVGLSSPGDLKLSEVHEVMREYQEMAKFEGEILDFLYSVKDRYRARLKRTSQGPSDQQNSPPNPS